MYPFREFVLDTVIWTRATDVDEERQGPLLVMGLGGTAARLAREVPPDVQAHGGLMDLGDGWGRPGCGFSGDVPTTLAIWLNLCPSRIGSKYPVRVESSLQYTPFYT